jgi:hypothetical protein
MHSFFFFELIVSSTDISLSRISVMFNSITKDSVKENKTHVKKELIQSDFDIL